jgi:hypothetical protein
MVIIEYEELHVDFCAFGPNSFLMILYFRGFTQYRQVNSKTVFKTGHGCLLLKPQLFTIHDDLPI